ncbi:DNA-protecting protein DprA [Ponticoccus sp. SC2-23]|uniref:DNA-processing protein DprA n=1 Tax=Alexandriicola marinus TaxID=2081710 RepID=UPI000FD73941|nr:DNA-processing protein DprA [Alexandriicola marinus]MBM1221562.1 DNA-protecting protein DprA [Ponticoccus sp. SC6-9]MBM1226603.1 DNA-protecting protein DprA [Ponticoccus sp. SC6-15]MBM1230554.1 DNA-protecting protein DprA [Ponticoccus sp. SC6-38]MBM1235077.1 DNA-protecting protein DprA [Ponticoccus sp. SC6-45]MBM1239575.1 DNA-protecting protein DprA [Ponticoccus sp. SC6-49]MBM1243357.1 DNA-protecting protein DprA [Ponticoccus sp. SC2-64]MBM1248601.1 DNA-protecting protein DprA [Ponticoccu
MAGDPTSSAHPPLPPTTEDDRFLLLRLLRSRRVGVATFWRLLDQFGSAAAALDALPEIARAAGVEDYAPCPEGVVAAEMKAARRSGARAVFHGEPDYPALLTGVEDAPPILWISGDSDLLCRPMIAIVGSRTASSAGTRMARRLAADLSEAGFVVVSGLARGIDAVAHDAALKGGTIAVMAGGVDVIYPQENADLAARIKQDGLVLSEQPMGLQPLARHFPMRNRIVSGVARAVVVVEAAAKSGSLITARCALDQGREVMAVPGHPFEGRASGCNILIRDGATLIRSAEDILDVTGPAVVAPLVQRQPNLFVPEGIPDDRPAPHPPAQPLRQVAALHDRILSRIGAGPISEDELIRDLATPPREIAPALVDLELDGRIRRDAAGLLSREV